MSTTCVVVWSGVLFFKQKTAYEMRISDWSSDVCSSDLVGGDRDRLGRFQHAVEVGIGHLAVADRHDARRVAALHVVAGNRRVDRADLAAEIGRASCRKRVWQYV